MEDETVEMIEWPKFLEIKYSGFVDEKTMFQLVQVIKQESQKRKNCHVLIDLTGSIGNIDSSTRFKIGFYLAEHLGSEFRLGVCADKARINMIAKTVAETRGVNIFVHQEKSKVESWLLHA
ncbi:MAG: hypothetical protein HY774_21720 [Acidobacteria bacterium]|nr:hypothetical protein [Acidobacteriota bacterium]